MIWILLGVLVVVLIIFTLGLANAAGADTRWREAHYKELHDDDRK